MCRTSAGQILPRRFDEDLKCKRQNMGVPLPEARLID
jgi:hypothetical protein